MHNGINTRNMYVQENKRVTMLTWVNLVFLFFIRRFFTFFIPISWPHLSQRGHDLTQPEPTQHRDALYSHIFLYPRFQPQLNPMVHILKKIKISPIHSHVKFSIYIVAQINPKALIWRNLNLYYQGMLAYWFN